MQLQEIIMTYPIYAFLFCLVFSYPSYKILYVIVKLLWEISIALLGLLIQKLMEPNMNNLVRNARICRRDGMEARTLIDLFLSTEEEINKLQKRMEDLEKSNES